MHWIYTLFPLDHSTAADPFFYFFLLLDIASSPRPRFHTSTGPDWSDRFLRRFHPNLVRTLVGFVGDIAVMGLAGPTKWAVIGQLGLTWAFSSFVFVVFGR